MNIFWETKVIRYNNNGKINLQINNQFENSFQYSDPKQRDIKILVINIFYFFLLLFFFLIQPVNLIVSCIQDTKHIKQYMGFIFLFFLPTVNYIWLKYYLTSNHLEMMISSYESRYISHKIIIATSLACSIFYIIFIVYLYGNPRNKSYFSNNSENGFWIFFVFNELITKTLIFHNYLITIIVFYRHNKQISNYIHDIENRSNFVLDANSFIYNLIKEISNLKMKVETSIYYFNTLISLSTILVCFAVFLFFDVVFRQDEHLVNYIDASVFTIFYLLVQCIFFIIIYNYANNRIKLYNAIASHSFLNKYIFIKTIQMQDETNKISAILNWMTLKEILQNDWIDFRIMGISSKDGDLIKKSIALASLLIIIFSV